jgi:hypothetical protein
MSFFKKKENILYITSAIILALIPIVALLGRLLVNRHTLTDVWPISSTWNDEAMYYKQVESIVKFGISQGYFGYNESSAAHLSFGAWNPVIFLFWALWGKVFGWSFTSPYIFNTVFFALSLFVFGLLSKIKIKEACLICLSFLAFTPLSKFLLSYMPETFIWGLLIILIGLFISSENNQTTLKTVFIFFILFYLVLIRPYFAVLFIFPFLLSFNCQKKKKALMIIISAVLCILSVVLFFILGKAFTAAYVKDVSNNFFSKIFTHGPRLVLREMLDVLKYNNALVFFYIKQSFSSSSHLGAYYFTFIASSLLILVRGIIAFIKKEQQTIKLKYVLLFLSQVAVYLSIMVLYNIDSGYRHVICFIILDLIFILADDRLKSSIKYICEGVFIALFIYFFTIKGNIPEIYGVPYLDHDSKERVEFSNDKEFLSESLVISGSSRWDNTVDVLLAEGSSLDSFYILPTGFGINLCERDYLETNITGLKSSYLEIPLDSSLYETALNSGWKVLYQNKKNALLYK